MNSYKELLESLVCKLIEKQLSYNDTVHILHESLYNDCPQDLLNCAKKICDKVLFQKDEVFVVEDMSKVNSVSSALNMIEKEYPTDNVKELVSLLRQEIATPEEDDEKVVCIEDDESDGEWEEKAPNENDCVDYIDKREPYGTTLVPLISSPHDFNHLPPVKDPAPLVQAFEEALEEEREEENSSFDRPWVNKQRLMPSVATEEETEEVDVEKELEEGKVLTDDQKILLEKTKGYIEELIGKKETAKTPKVRGTLKEVKRKIKPQIRPTVFDNLLNGDLDLTVDDMQELANKAAELSKTNKENKV